MGFRLLMAVWGMLILCVYAFCGPCLGYSITKPVSKLEMAALTKSPLSDYDKREIEGTLGPYLKNTVLCNYSRCWRDAVQSLDSSSLESYLSDWRKDDHANIEQLIKLLENLEKADYDFTWFDQLVEFKTVLENACNKAKQLHNSGVENRNPQMIQLAILRLQAMPGYNNSDNDVLTFTRDLTTLNEELETEAEQARQVEENRRKALEQKIADQRAHEEAVRKHKLEMQQAEEEARMAKEREERLQQQALELEAMINRSTDEMHQIHEAKQQSEIDLKEINKQIEKAQAELLEKFRSELKGGIFETGLSGEKLEVLSFLPGSNALKIKSNTGEWLGIFQDTELSLKLSETLIPVHRLCREYPQLKTIVVEMVAPAAKTKDEFGNELPPSTVIIAILEIDCDDFRKFNEDKVSALTAVYIADRYDVRLNTNIRKSWFEESREQAKQHFY